MIPYAKYAPKPRAIPGPTPQSEKLVPRAQGLYHKSCSVSGFEAYWILFLCRL